MNGTGRIKTYLSLNDVSIKYMQVFCVNICLRAVSKEGGRGGEGRDKNERLRGTREMKIRRLENEMKIKDILEGKRRRPM